LEPAIFLVVSAAFDRTCSAVPALTVEDRPAPNNGNLFHCALRCGGDYLLGSAAPQLRAGGFAGNTRYDFSRSALLVSRRAMRSPSSASQTAACVCAPTGSR
jgi:hypothetical protein